jgi:hypothetical protein
MTAEPLPAVVARHRERAREDGGAAAFADAAFTGADALADWLRDCAGKLERREFVLPSLEDEPDTLQLWLNDVAFNTDRWFLAPIAFAWASRDADLQFSGLLDGVVGHEAGDIKTSDFTLTGLEDFQALMSPEDADIEVASMLVVGLAMELVDRALALTGALGIRVALVCSEEPTIGLWEHDGDGWVASVHTEDGV